MNEMFLFMIFSDKRIPVMRLEYVPETDTFALRCVLNIVTLIPLLILSEVLESC